MVFLSPGGDEVPHMRDINFSNNKPRINPLQRAKTSHSRARWKTEAKERHKLRQQRKIDDENTALAARLQVLSIEPSRCFY